MTQLFSVMNNAFDSVLVIYLILYLDGLNVLTEVALCDHEYYQVFSAG